MTTYRDAGVDLDRADEVVRRLARLVPGIGGFGGVLPLDLDGMKKPVLVAGADGVGTKALLSSLADRHDTIGIDLVAMNANDVLCHGARPLLFLDYVAVGRIDPAMIEALVGGMKEGCRIAGCRLLGGETAEMPDLYEPGAYDLAGFCVGVAEEARLLGPARVREGDVLLGLASSGLHSNGFSLVRRALGDRLALEKGLLDEVLAPTRIYARPVLDAAARLDVRAAAHITGGGLPGNVPRVLPAGLGARIDPGAWEEPGIFGRLRETGIPEEEMRRTFNMGIGMVLVVSPADADAAAAVLSEGGERVFRIGRVESGDGVAWGRSA